MSSFDLHQHCVEALLELFYRGHVKRVFHFQAVFFRLKSRSGRASERSPAKKNPLGPRHGHGFPGLRS